MCGLVGAAGNLNHKHGLMFRDMLSFDYIRGRDSTGVAFVPLVKKDGPVVEKELGHPGNLWDYGSDLFNFNGSVKGNHKAMIGHNRAATKGAVTAENAHPFTFNHITGVHNGSLRVWDKLTNYKEHDVDSKAIFDTIAERGIEDCWKSFHGAAALVWWDNNTEQLHMVRNDERPLFTMRSKDKGVLFWASEPWMITVAAERHNIDLLPGKSGKPLVERVEVDKLYTFAPKAITCDLVEVRDLEKKPLPTRTGGQNTGAGMGFYRGRSTNPHRSSISSNKKRRSFDRAWAQGLSKGDKTLVGTEFCLSSIIYTMGAIGSARITGQTRDGETVHIYPDNQEALDYWTKMLNTHRMQYAFKFVHRPREQKVGKTEQLFAYCISTTGITKIETVDLKAEEEIQVPHDFSDTTMFKSWDNNLVTELRWKELMAETASRGTCCHCSDTITIDMADEISWSDRNTVFCKACKESLIQNAEQSFTQGKGM